jgi:deazaflavin-dependent oxidoreductase (nitroreductase family)
MIGWTGFCTRMHVFLYRLTGGFLGSRMAGQRVLLLFTTGNKSGKKRITPINYFPDSGRYVVVASNWGRKENPDWYFNLRALPDAAVQEGRRLRRVRAEEAVGGEYSRLWKLVTQTNPFYAEYQRQAGRKIPLFILTPGEAKD